MVLRDRQDGVFIMHMLQEHMGFHKALWSETAGSWTALIEVIVDRSGKLQEIGGGAEAVTEEGKEEKEG